MKEESKATPMEKLATFIVDKRNLFFLLYIFAIVFCFFSTNWVKVENDITTYLPEDTETRQGLTLMNDEFITYGTARVMVSNITYATGETLQDEIEDISGVSGVEYDHTEDHYKNSSALFTTIIAGLFPCAGPAGPAAARRRGCAVARPRGGRRASFLRQHRARDRPRSGF